MSSLEHDIHTALCEMLQESSMRREANMRKETLRIGKGMLTKWCLSYHKKRKTIDKINRDNLAVALSRTQQLILVLSLEQHIKNWHHMVQISKPKEIRLSIAIHRVSDTRWKCESLQSWRRNMRHDKLTLTSVEPRHTPLKRMSTNLTSRLIKVQLKHWAEMQKTLELLRAGHSQEQRRKARNIDSRDQAATCRGAAGVPKLTLKQFRGATPCYPWSSAYRHFTEDRSLMQLSGNLSQHLEACGVRCELPQCEQGCTCTSSEPINTSGQPIDRNQLINDILTHTCEDNNSEISDGKTSRLSVPILAAGLGRTRKPARITGQLRPSITIETARRVRSDAARGDSAVKSDDQDEKNASAVESHDEDGENTTQSILYGNDEEKEEPTADGISQDDEESWKRGRLDNLTKRGIRLERHSEKGGAWPRRGLASTRRGLTSTSYCC